MNSQYEDTKDSAGAGRRHADGSNKTGALLRCGTRLALAATILAALALAAGESRAQQRVTLANTAHAAAVLVTVGKSQDVHIDQSLVDITVGDPDIADVNALTDHALSILGKKIGTTRVTVYGEGKKLIGIFDVEVSYDIPRLNAEIAHFAGGGIRVSSVNGRIMLSGMAPDAVTLDKAVMIARQFGPDVINTAQVASPQQIMLEVRFIEVDRSASRELGFQWNMFGGHTIANVGNQVTANNQQPPFLGAPQLPLTTAVAAGVLSGTPPFGFLLSQLVGGKSPLDVSINALETKGLARSLAEPNLVALSGDTASFLAGGQIPIPEVGATGTPSFGFQPFGVGLSFTPTVLKDGLINLVVKPEVSELDPAHGVQIAGTFVPALTTRKASTTLELRDGQSFMLGGLLQNTSTANQNQLPWAGDVPVLGALFRSSQYQKNETDLVILVTPHIIRPLPPNALLRTPLDNTLPGNDIDFFLMGQAEVSPALARLAVGALSRPYVGHILDLPKNGATYVSVKD